MKSTFQNWRQLLAIQAGGALCLPLFVVGYELAKNYGFTSALAVIVIGNILLYILAMITFDKCFVKRHSTSELAVEVFGSAGKYFFSTIMVLSMIGWFAIQLMIMGDALCTLLNIPGAYVIQVRIGLGLLTLMTAVFGLKGLETVANLSLPLLCLTMGYALYTSEGPEPTVQTGMEFTLAGAGLVIAACISAVIDLPTFFCRAKSKNDGKIAITLLFCGVIPVIQAAGVYLCFGSYAESLPEVLILTSSHPLWKIWIALFILFAGWTTNNTNIYSAGINMIKLVPVKSDILRISLAGGLAIGLSAMSLTGNFEVILNLIGIFLTGMGAVTLLSKEGDSTTANLFAWTVGAAFGLVAMTGAVELTGLPVLDSFIISFFIKLGSVALGYHKINSAILGAENE